MKVIDILNKMANGELEDGTHIRNIEHDCEYVYHKKDCRFEFVKKGIWEDYFYKFDISELNDEIEIIEESKEEFEEIELIETPKIDLIGNMRICNAEYKINKLIANQNKIIRKLKANKENE